MNPAHLTVIIHDLGTVGRTVNRPLLERSAIGLSPLPVVEVASSIRVHTLQVRVIDALAEWPVTGGSPLWFRSTRTHGCPTQSAGRVSQGRGDDCQVGRDS